MKKDVKSALKASLMNEEKSVRDRFEKAESVISKREEAGESKQPETISVQTREKVRRDTFTMLEKDNASLRDLKMRCMKAGCEVSKSEIVRAGIQMLNDLTDSELVSAVENLERMKVGRKPIAKRV